MFSWESSLIKWSIFRDHLNINKNLYWKIHDDVIKWRHSPCYWSFVWGIHRSPVDSPHKGQWGRALMFFICSWINSWVNNREAGNLRCHGGHYDVIVIRSINWWQRSYITSYMRYIHCSFSKFATYNHLGLLSFGIADGNARCNMVIFFNEMNTLNKLKKKHP